MGRVANPVGIVTALASIALHASPSLSGLYSGPVRPRQSWRSSRASRRLGLGIFRVDGETPRLGPTTPASVGEPAGEVPPRNASRRFDPSTPVIVGHRPTPVGHHHRRPARRLAEGCSTRYPIRNLLTVSRVYRDAIEGPIDIEAEFRPATTEKRRTDLPGRRGPRRRSRRPSRAGSARTERQERRRRGLRGRGILRPQDGRPGPGRLARGHSMRRRCPCSSTPGSPAKVARLRGPYRANPSLVYARTREPRTRMKSRREGSIDDLPVGHPGLRPIPRVSRLRLVAGERIGLEVAVINKDSHNGLSAWMYWGPQYTGFKGCESSTSASSSSPRGPQHQLTQEPTRRIASSETSPARVIGTSRSSPRANPSNCLLRNTTLSVPADRPLIKTG